MLREPREITQLTVDGMTFETEKQAAIGSKVIFGFTQRTGGVSEAPYNSLNLGDHVGDVESRVFENRKRAFRGLAKIYSTTPPQPDLIINPRQVHGDNILICTEPLTAAACSELSSCEADAVVCTSQGVGVLLCFADCVPVILLTSQGFAVIHAGWKGAILDICAKACIELCAQTNSAPSEIVGYIGPHISKESYEVSVELIEKFVGQFGTDCDAGKRRLSLSAAVRASLVQAGMCTENIFDRGAEADTFIHSDQYFSYRSEGPVCGRHGALAWIHQHDCATVIA